MMPATREAAVIQSVTGPVSGADLGPTLVHEHIFNASPGVWDMLPETVGGRVAFTAKAIERVRQAYDEAGIRTIVDLTPYDLGRPAELLRQVSEATGMRIVAATGHHNQFNATTASMSAEDLGLFFTREIEAGIGDTGIRAGIIKIATREARPENKWERVFRAAAWASLTTGTPISTHAVAPNHGGIGQLDVLEAEGVPPTRVCIGHCDDGDEYEYVMELARRGCWLGFDRFPGGPGGARFGALWSTRVDFLYRLISDGFLDQILVSHDLSLALTAFPADIVSAYESLTEDGFVFIHRAVLPRLRELGADESVITKLLQHNPRRFLTHE